MTVLVATPCYGGAMTVGFFRTCMGIIDQDVEFLVTEGESHVTRARNNLCATFLRTEYETIAFIDADIEMKGEDFARLAAMDGVRGAAVACKTADNSEHLSVFADGKHLTRSEMPRKPFLVDYLGSAVLFIDRLVLERLKPRVASYHDPIVGRAWAFFWDGVHGDSWLSEDFGLCQSCADEGIPIHCDPDVIVKHYGSQSWQH